MEFSVLGPLEVCREGAAVALPGGKPRAVLAVLLLHANEPVSAERLAAALWGEDVPGGAIRTVQVYVSRLRRALGEDGLLVTSRAGYRLRVRPGELDLDRFGRLVEEGRRALGDARAGEAGEMLREALGLWRGPALADLAFEPFAHAEIARLEELRQAAMELRIEADLAAGQHVESVPELQRLVDEHPLRERLHGLLMLALYRSGRQAEALDVYRDARRVLVEQLGIEPGAELQQLQQAMLVHDPAIQAPRAAPGPRSGRVSAQHVNVPVGRGLPPLPNRTIGRKHDVGAVVEMLRADWVRLLTLTGPGGVGKTRVALECARALEADFADGACFVSLGAVERAEDVPATLLTTLEIAPPAGESVDRAIERYLADKQLLLVLDNFEHVLAAAALVSLLVDSCRGLTVLATSREPLNVTAEERYLVQPLTLPEPMTPDDPDALACADAVALFYERARGHDPGLHLGDSNAPAVARICRRLDGLPLAIELAAARCDLLSVEELASRLTAALPLLTGGARDAPARQRTLRATVDWSHNLLTSDERRTFALMAVFAGGATVTAAETVTGGALDTLDSLVAKQLLRRGAQRLHMLETVREYALERLAEQPAGDGAWRRLAEWCRNLAREALPSLSGTGRVRTLAQLDAELPNALSALEAALDRGWVQVGVDLVEAWSHYWWLGLRREQGVRWIGTVLARAGDPPPELLLAHARVEGLRTADRPRQRSDLLTALEGFRARDDARGIADCLSRLAVYEAWRDEFAQAPALIDEAMRQAERAGHDPTTATVLVHSVVAADGFDAMALRARQAIPRLIHMGYLDPVTGVASPVGYVGLAERRYREARDWFEQGLLAARRLHDPMREAGLLTNLGLAQLFLGETQAAQTSFADALRLVRKRDPDAPFVPECLLGLAVLAGRVGDRNRSARLAATAKAQLQPGNATAEDEVWRRLSALLPEVASDHQDWDVGDHAAAALDPRAAIDTALAGN